MGVRLLCYSILALLLSGPLAAVEDKAKEKYIRQAFADSGIKADALNSKNAPGVLRAAHSGGPEGFRQHLKKIGISASSAKSNKLYIALLKNKVRQKMQKNPGFQKLGAETQKEVVEFGVLKIIRSFGEKRPTLTAKQRINRTKKTSRSPVNYDKTKKRSALKTPTEFSTPMPDRFRFAGDVEREKDNFAPPLPDRFNLGFRAGRKGLSADTAFDKTNIGTFKPGRNETRALIAGVDATLSWNTTFTPPEKDKNHLPFSEEAPKPLNFGNGDIEARFTLAEQTLAVANRALTAASPFSNFKGALYGLSATIRPGDTENPVHAAFAFDGGIGQTRLRAQFTPHLESGEGRMVTDLSHNIGPLAFGAGIVDQEWTYASGSVSLPKGTRFSVLVDDITKEERRTKVTLAKGQNELNFDYLDSTLKSVQLASMLGTPDARGTVAFMPGVKGFQDGDWAAGLNIRGETAQKLFGDQVLDFTASGSLGTDYAQGTAAWRYLTGASLALSGFFREGKGPHQKDSTGFNFRLTIPNY